MPPSSVGSKRISYYFFDIDRVQRGDILLTRVPFEMQDPSTWVSQAIQKSTSSRYSHASLCVSYGMFVEAIGPGVCRLAIKVAGIRDEGNVCLLRLNPETVPDAEKKANQAAECGERYLLRGYSTKGALGVKIGALQDPNRAALFCSQLVALAYKKADLDLVPEKTPDEIAPGEFVESPYLKSVTKDALLKCQTDIPPLYYLDDGSLFERPHHWEVVTKLKVLYSKQVQQALGRLNKRPASFWELEGVLAEHKAAPLDKAILLGLKAHRFAEVLLEKRQSIPIEV